MSTVAESLSHIRLGEPQAHQNLSLFPLLGEAANAPEYLLLEEALARGLVRVTEVSEGRSTDTGTRLVRARHGARPAARMLTAGLNLLPESTALRLQLLLDLGALLERAEAGERASVAGFFTRVHAGLDPRALPPAALERLDYPYLAALTALGQLEARNRYFWRTAIRRARDPGLRARMIGLLREAPGEGVGVSGTTRGGRAANASFVGTRPVATGRGGRAGPVPSYPGRRGGGG